jgi:tetratricopeptide (TPR) repeat protein
MDYLSLCLICKDENDYLPEWLDYHILMGVDRFYIYDNESQVSLRESLADYIERGWAVVVDIPGKAMQLHAYDHCLQTFGYLTFWMGFIDTDEFLVPKTSPDLKELLKGYEQYAGLAVSSLFFGSSGHQTRPTVGQISAYTRRTHATFKENEMVKSIIQPSQALMPNSPHDFIYKESAWCVNEGFLRVDGQRFPNCTELIQLNHYYCRSEKEIDQKLRRGNSQSVVWVRQRFEAINSMATTQDTNILQNLEILLQQVSLASHNLTPAPRADSLLEKMAVLVRTRRPAHATEEMILPRAALSFRAEFSSMVALKAQIRTAIMRKEFEEARRLKLLRLQSAPQNILLYVELASDSLDLADFAATWQMLSLAWRLSPNNYLILRSMVIYFLRIENFNMAEKTCRLLLDLSPHNLDTLGLLTHSLIGLGRHEEAIQVGLPVVELSTFVRELPDGMGVFLVKQMADYLLEKKDYTGAARLWAAGVKCQPGDVNALLQLSQSLLLTGDKDSARDALFQARKLDPQNEAVLDLIRQVNALRPAHHVHKRKH